MVVSWWYIYKGLKGSFHENGGGKDEGGWKRRNNLSHTTAEQGHARPIVLWRGGRGVRKKGKGKGIETRSEAIRTLLTNSYGSRMYATHMDQEFKAF